ncbi:poly-gamma-glutamate hydrolase family protein, partial [Staphylococcus aureus]|nr:poly-gamma-glutamate hydrolase family protein [Staphylococcus aureus]
NVIESPSHLEGESSQNIANKNAKGAGVQLELTYALRQSFFNNQNLSMNSRSNEANWSITMYTFAEAIHQALEANG